MLARKRGYAHGMLACLAQWGRVERAEPHRCTRTDHIHQRRPGLRRATTFSKTSHHMSAQRKRAGWPSLARLKARSVSRRRHTRLPFISGCCRIAHFDGTRADNACSMSLKSSNASSAPPSTSPVSDPWPATASRCCAMTPARGWLAIRTSSTLSEPWAAAPQNHRDFIQSACQFIAKPLISSTSA